MKLHFELVLSERKHNYKPNLENWIKLLKLDLKIEYKYRPNILRLLKSSIINIMYYLLQFVNLRRSPLLFRALWWLTQN